MKLQFLKLFSQFLVKFNFCYSWDVGTAHFIVFSTEVYFFLRDGGIDLAEYQYNWLEEDLKVY